MELFGALFSPFVRKAAVAAAEKGIELAHPPTSFAEPSADFLAASPFRKIPALKDGDFLLADSTAICTYFDGIAPTPPLWPAPPRDRARAVWFEEVADTVIMPAAGPCIFNRFVLPRFRGVAGDEEAALAAIAKLEPIWDYMDSVAPDDGYLAGDFSLGDIAVASMIRTLDYVDAMPDADRWPRMMAWYARVVARPAWHAVAQKEAAQAQAAGLS